MNAQANSDDDSVAVEAAEKSEAAAKSNADDKPESTDASAESDPDKDDNSQDDGKVPFAESDYRETKMTYDHGKLPLYVAAVWLVGLVGLVAYYIGYGLPDLEQWGAP